MTAATLTITDFLLARIAEDEAVAKAAHLDSMRGHAGPGFSRSLVAWSAQAEGVRGRALIERFTPARVLAECAAKRAIVDEHAEAEAFYAAHLAAPAGELAGLRTALAHLTAVYSDHEDFNPEWRP